MAAAKYLDIVAGVITQKSASETTGAEVLVSTLPSGLLDISFMPTGIGPDTRSILTSEALAAGAYVNVFNNAGTANARNADASSASAGKRAHGFVLAAFGSGVNALVYFGGLNTAVTGLTVGEQYLSGATPGAGQSAAPTTSAWIVQSLGIAVATTAMQFEPQMPVILA